MSTYALAAAALRGDLALAESWSTDIHERLPSFGEMGGEPHRLSRASLVFLASCEGHAELVRSLVARGADPTVTTDRGCTPLYAASYRGHEAVVRALVELRADPNVPGYDGRTPLWLASGGGHEATVRTLVELRADPSIPGDEGRTPLWIASGRGHEATVLTLVELRADPTTPDENGVTPFRIANLTWNEATARLLRVLCAEHGDTSVGCSSLDVVSVPSFSPVRRYVLSKRRRLPVSALRLSDACILSLLRATVISGRVTCHAAQWACLPADVAYALRADVGNLALLDSARRLYSRGDVADLP